MTEQQQVALPEENRSALASQLDLVLEATGVGIWEYDHGQNLLIRSAALDSVLRFDPLGVSESLELVLQRVEPADRAMVRQAFLETLPGEAGQFVLDYRIRDGAGRLRWFSSRGRVTERDAAGKPLRSVGIAIDVTQRLEQQQLLLFGNTILRQISVGAPLADVLDYICREIEARDSTIQCSILLMDEDGLHLRHGAAPSMPKAYCALVDGLAIGPAAGSCGTAAFRGKDVFVSDIANDPLWADYRDVSLTHGLAACWSSPILSAEGLVLGTFGIYWSTPSPEITQTAQDHVSAATALAAIAIGNARREAVLLSMHQGLSQADLRLQEQLVELRRWQKLMIGREERVLELKREVNGLLARLGESVRYASVAPPGGGE
ncbi:GAF domain-containing protein [Azonexus sp.]|uniref:GAF domain-containing protein n=1 Tax=Azonexus sp. TaxID=1872668 RepID=UPI0027B9EF59|nr:GAF domain-containing protein [Azonexus sp.]